MTEDWFLQLGWIEHMPLKRTYSGILNHARACDRCFYRIINRGGVAKHCDVYDLKDHQRTGI